MNRIHNTLKRVFEIKRSSPFVQPLITLLYVDVVHALLILTLLVFAMVVDHELIVRTLILSVYILCPMSALDLIRHINIVTREEYQRVNPKSEDNFRIDRWADETTTDMGLLWLLPPVFSSFFLAGSFVDFALYINHEVEHSEPPGRCDNACIASIFGALVSGFLFISSILYITMMVRIFRKLKVSE